jgi:hypothetical protein
MVNSFSNVLTRPVRTSSGYDIVEAIRNSPAIMKELERNTQAWLDGKYKTLSQVIDELETK